MTLGISALVSLLSPKGSSDILRGGRAHRVFISVSSLLHHGRGRGVAPSFVFSRHERWHSVCFHPVRRISRLFLFLFLFSTDLPYGGRSLDFFFSHSFISFLLFARTFQRKNEWVRGSFGLAPALRERRSMIVDRNNPGEYDQHPGREGGREASLYVCSRGHCMQGFLGKPRSIRGLVSSAPSPLFFFKLTREATRVRAGGGRIDRWSMHVPLVLRSGVTRHGTTTSVVCKLRARSW